MNRIRHLCAKDFRRVRLAWGAWLASGLVLVTLLGWLMEPEATTDFERALRGLARFGWYCRAAMVAIAAGAFSLAGLLALEDSPLGSDSFYLSRPVSGLRLLAAKGLLASLLLILVPVLVMASLWLAVGFSVGPIAALVPVLSGGLAVIVIAGLALGSMSMDLGEVAFAGVVVFACGALALIFPDPFLPLDAGAKDAGLQADLPVLGLALLALVAMLFHQFVRRGGARWWTVMAGLLPGMLVARVAWPAGLSRPERLPWPPGPLQVEALRPALPGSVSLHVRSSRDSFHGTWLAAWSARGHVEDAGGKERLPVVLMPAPSWGAAAARWVATKERSPARLAWPLVSGPEATAAEASLFRGEVTIARTRVDVLAQLPVRSGATSDANGNRVTVLGVRGSGRSLELLVHEWEAGVSPSPGDDHASRDVYLLQSGGSERWIALRGEARAAARVGLIDSRLRILTADPEADTQSGVSEIGSAPGRGGATLVRVRLSRGPSWVQAVHALELAGPDGKGGA